MLSTLRASTNERVATSRASAAPSGGSGTVAGSTAGGTPSSSPARAASRSTRRTLSSTTASATVPARTAATSAAPHGSPAAGITTSSPALALASVLRAAVQSEITTPSKPHSSFSRSCRSGRCSVMVAPLTPLYAAITAQTPAATIRSNGRR